ncbi:MAG: MFS transporter [Actinomycetales bacterium]
MSAAAPTPGASPASPAQNPVKRPALALAFLGILGALQGTDPNIASTALVGAARGLDMGGTSLAASISTLALAATAISTGLLADSLGRRKVLQVALVVTIVGDLVVFLAPDTPVYLVGRVIAGIGLGAVYGAAFAYIRAAAKPGKLAAAMGMFTAVLMVSTMILTFIGGALSSIQWRTAFLVIPIASAISFFIVPILLPKEPRLKLPGKDILGQVLLGLGIIGLLGGISELGKSLTSPIALGGIGVGIALLIVWVIWESRDDKRFFPVKILKNPIFLAAIVAGFVYNFGNAVAFLQLTNLWQYVNGLKTLQVAMWQLPLLLAGIVAGLVTGRLMSSGKLSARAVLLLGGVVSAVGMVLLALTHTGKSLWTFLPGEFLVGAGVVIAAVPYGSLILKEAPAKYFGPVSSSRLTFGQFFYAIGFAASTIVIDKLTLGGTVAKLEAAGVPATQVGTGLDAVTTYAAQSTAPTTSVGKEALADATVSYGGAFATMMYITAVLMLLGGLLGYVLLRRAGKHADDETVESVKHPVPSTSSG